MNRNKIYSSLLITSLIINLSWSFFINSSFAENNLVEKSIENKKNWLSSLKKDYKDNSIQSSVNNEDLAYIEWDLIIKYKKWKEKSFDKKLSSLKKDWFEVNSKKLDNEIQMLRASNKTTKQLINELKNDSNIEYVQPNFIYKTQSFSANDEFYNNLWWLENNWQNINWINWVENIDIDWNLAMNVFSWSTAWTGNIVAVIDTWINYNHLDLKNKLWDGNNCLSENGSLLWGCKYWYDFHDGDKDPMDTHWHWTHVSGTIAAELDNIWIVWVNPNTKIMAIKWIWATWTTANLVKSINFARNNQAKIINASWWGYYLNWQTCNPWDNPFFDFSLYNAINDFKSVWWLFIAAAWNGTKNHEDPTNRFFPAWFWEDFSCWNLSVPWLDNIISVASIDNTWGISYFSDYWSGSVHIWAPWSDILSTYIDNSWVDILDWSLYSYSSTWLVLPDYLTWAVWNWWIGDTLRPWVYYDIYPDMNNPYAQNSNFKVDSINFDLSSLPLWNKLYIKYLTECKLPTNNNWADYLRLLFSKDWGNTYEEITRYNGNWDSFKVDSFEITDEYKTSNFKFRFNWVSWNDLNVAEWCNVSPNIYMYYMRNHLYQFSNWTSMATPHVTWLASLAWNYRQDLNYLDIKNAILNSWDDMTSLNWKTITWKKINVHSTLQNLAKVENINNIKIYTDNTKQQEITTLSKTSTPYIEWSDDTNPYIFSWYILNVKNWSWETLLTENTQNKFLTWVNINKTWFYNFWVYTQLLNNSTWWLISSQNIYFDLNPDWELNFLSWAYTNNPITKINFSSTKTWTYLISWDILSSITWSLISQETLDININSDDWIKNISVKITDENENTKTLTGSIILDTTNPVFEDINIENNDKFSSGTIIVSGKVNELNNDILTINSQNVSLNTNGTFSKEINLIPWINNIIFNTIDKAWNTGSVSKEIIRIWKSPIVNSELSFWKLKFNLIKEFIWTWVILYGTWDLNNTLTWWTQTTESLEISVLPETTYYYKAYFVNNWFESLTSNTWSFKTPFFLESNISWEYSLTWTTNIVDATSSWVVFTQTWVIILKTDNSNYIKINTNWLEIKTQSWSWDWVIKSPEKVTSSWTLNINWYTRINNLTFKIWSDKDNLIFSWWKVEVSLNIWSIYNWKTLKIYRSWDNQKSFEFLTSCIVSNSICKFETTKFSHFAFMQEVPKTTNNSSSWWGGWGGWWSFYIQPTQNNTIQENKITTNEKKVIKKEVIEYNWYALVRYDWYGLSKKVEKISKAIINYKKLDENFKKNFVNNLNNFLIAKYELNNSKEKTTKLKNNYNKQVILLKNSIKKLNQELKKKK